MDDARHERMARMQYALMLCRLRAGQPLIDDFPTWSQWTWTSGFRHVATALLLLILLTYLFVVELCKRFIHTYFLPFWHFYTRKSA